MIRFLLWVLGAILLGGIVHLATVLVLPRAANQDAFSRLLPLTKVNAVVPLPSPTAGSSIMPNKKNPDVVELLRASPAPVIGWMSDLQQMTIDDLRAWYHQWYVPNNATIVVVGDVQPQQVFKLAKQIFASIPARNSTAIKPMRSARCTSSISRST